MLTWIFHLIPTLMVNKVIHVNYKIKVNRDSVRFCKNVTHVLISNALLWPHILMTFSLQIFLTCKMLENWHQNIIVEYWKWLNNLYFFKEKARGSFTYYVTQKNEILDPLVTNFPRKIFFFVWPVTKSQTPLPPKKRT